MDDSAETQDSLQTPDRDRDRDRDRAPFLPGTVLDGRYRIVALVGRGGMGEVYRADDLKIGQPVALKFLPADLEHDPSRFQRLMGEVRIARQVTHPNVCRVYDVGEFDRHPFITMEYVDGEDLSALLRRIGRLPQEKALDLARQIGAGLAAAHAQGIVHRDLKPANVMLDGRGRARMTDFGLAVAAEAVRGTEARSGTPGYMAPEQIEGSAITPRTDVYALGLLLYEMITGKRADPGVGSESRTAKFPARPSSFVPGLDPAVDATILRCLERDPMRRPASAAEFLRSLPGEDPLQAALRAGDTPSPEMVAAAGPEEALSPAKALCLLGLVFLTATAAIVVGASVTGFDRVPMVKSPDVLSERAREVVRMLGDDTPPRAVEWSVGLDDGYAEWYRAHPHALTPLETRPSVIRFHYRGSPMPIYSWKAFIPTRRDPPASWSGETYVAIDLQGNLLDFSRIVRQVETADAVPPASTDWRALLSLTGVDTRSLRTVPPLWTPDVPVDARAAWVVTDAPAPTRLEAAAWRGNPVWLRTIEPWEKAERDVASAAGSPIGLGVFVGLTMLVLLGMGALARRNLRLGRGDMRGAVRIAFVILLTYGVVYALSYRWSLEPMRILVFLLHAPYFFYSLFIWLVYLGGEPFLRRRWPHLLIAWTRLLEGKWLDPRVGRETLLGLLGGAAATLAGWLPAVLEGRQDMDTLLTVLPLGSAADFWAWVVGSLGDGVMRGLGGFGLLLLLRVLVRSDVLAWVGLGVLTLLASLTSLNITAAQWVGLMVAAASLVLAQRAGVAAGIAAVITTTLLSACTPLTVDFSRWYAWRTGVIAALLLVMAVWSFRAAIGRRSILSADVLEG